MLIINSRLVFSTTFRSCFKFKFIRQLHSQKILEKLRKRQLLVGVIPERPELETIFQKQQCIYAGFDPTADGLHFGNLLVLMSLLHFLRDGHQVVCLVGNATARIGDPSDKSGERPELPEEIIQRNTSAVSANISKIFSNHYKYFWLPNQKSNKTSQSTTTTTQSLFEPIILQNMDWYRNRNVIDFISTVGRKLRLSDMLSRKFVADRVKSKEGLSFTEFSYQVFQGYDWFHLFNKYNCRFQLGASDQIGNFHSGIHLVRKTKEEQVYGLSLPLIVDEEGNKYGKTLGNPIWLSADKRSPFDFYQFFIRLQDGFVEPFLRQFTFLQEDQIEAAMQARLRKNDPYYAHKLLANEITLLVHGAEGLRVAKQATKIFYDKDIQAVASLSHDDLDQIFNEDQRTTMYLNPDETTVTDVAIKCQAFLNSIDAVRTIQQGGFSVNHSKIKDPSRLIDSSLILNNNTTLIRIGKKRFYLIKWQ